MVIEAVIVRKSWVSSAYWWWSTHRAWLPMTSPIWDTCPTKISGLRTELCMWYTGSAAYCCRAVSFKSYKLLLVFDVGLQPFQRHVSVTEFISEPRHKFAIIDFIKRSRCQDLSCLWVFFHQSPRRSRSVFSEVPFELSGQSGAQTAADWSFQWQVYRCGFKRTSTNLAMILDTVGD